jgi:acetyl esterase
MAGVSCWTRMGIVAVGVMLGGGTGSVWAQPEAATPNAQMQAVLDVLRELGPKPIEELEPKQAREQPTIFDAATVLAKRKGLPTTPESVQQVEDLEIPGPGGQLKLRVYRPDGEAPLPVLVYFPGGGWVLGDLDTYDASCRALANSAGCLVLACDYRKAPESPYPAAADDALATYRWALENAGDFGGNPEKVAVGGESAGGNLAAVTARRAIQAGLPKPVHQLLIYPVTNYNFESPSYREHARAEPLNREMMRWFWGHYVSSAAEGVQPDASPLRAPGLQDLPSATVLTAEIDPLRSEGIEYATQLKAAGVKVHRQNFTRVTHEFFGLTRVLDTAREAVEVAASDLRAAFNGTFTGAPF